MDEPLGALDRQLREQMQFEIKRIHDRLGLTFISVTHDQQEALTMSDRIAVFQDGCVQQIGTPAEVYETPATSFVASFVGESNLVHGVVVSCDATNCGVMLPGGDVLRATPVDKLKVGDEAVVSIRPERVSLSGPSAHEANSFSAVIEEVIYVGDHHRVRVGFQDVNEFIVKVTAQNSRLLGPPGSKVVLGWRTEHGRAFRA